MARLNGGIIGKKNTTSFGKNTFTSRTSRFPNGTKELDNNKRPAHLVRWEQRAMQRFVEKWGRLPGEDEDSFVIPITGTNNPNKIEWPF